MSSALECKIRQIRHETVDEIQNLERAVARCDETLGRLQTSTTKYNPRPVIERATADRKRLHDQLEEHRRILERIDNGLYETQLKEEMERNREMIAQKTATTKRRKTEGGVTLGSAPPLTAKTRTPRFTVDPTHYSHPNYRENPHEARQREIQFGERQFMRDSASLPGHLAEKLKNMPNNLGYVWRDIWFCGELPAETHRELTLFEKRGPQFLTHVYTYDQYCVYEKDHNGRRRLLAKHPRVKLR